MNQNKVRYRVFVKVFYPGLDSGGTPEGLPEILTFFELSQPSTRVESGTVVVSTDKI
jgi:hypothetical protein